MADARLRQAVRLAYRDFIYERRVSVCFVLALMAVLAPLLVLFGLKFGLIDTIARRLVEDPRNREIAAVGSGWYDAAFFERAAALPPVAFIVPNTRSIAASLTLVRNPASSSVAVRGLQMIPTGPGDPLLTAVSATPAGLDEIVLSEAAARALEVRAGDTVLAMVTRRRAGQEQSVELPLSVVGVATEAAFGDEAAFVTLDLLVSTEDYRDGVAVAALDWPGDTAAGTPRIYARFRLYARSIYEVAALRDALEEMGIETRTRASEIESMQLLDRNLTRVFWLIALCGISGFLASLAANLLANVERKRKELSVLRLIGLPTAGVICFPIVQAVLTALLGGGLAILVYFAFAATLNSLFRTSLSGGETICRLLPQHIAVSLIATLAFAVAASGWAGYRASRIEPAEGIRDV